MKDAHAAVCGAGMIDTYLQYHPRGNQYCERCVYGTGKHKYWCPVLAKQMAQAWQDGLAPHETERETVEGALNG